MFSLPSIKKPRQPLAEKGTGGRKQKKELGPKAEKRSGGKSRKKNCGPWELMGGSPYGAPWADEVARDLREVARAASLGPWPDFGAYGPGGPMGGLGIRLPSSCRRELFSGPRAVRVIL